MLNITLIGTGALSPIPERALAAAALTAGGRVILFDCGEGTQTALRANHISPLKIDVIALTHYHGDHYFGLPGLLQTMLAAKRTPPLLIVGPEGISDAMAPVFALAGHLPYDVYLSEAAPDGIRLDLSFPAWPDGSILRAYPSRHSIPGVSYRFDLPRAGKFDPAAAAALGIPPQRWGVLQSGESVTLDDGREISPDLVLGPARRGLSFAYSGDTSPCPALIDAARDTDLFVCEGTYGDNADTQTALERGHSTYAMSARLAAQAGAQRLWLTHLSQSMENPEEFLPNAREFFPGAECGYDGMTLTLRFPER